MASTSFLNLLESFVWTEIKSFQKDVVTRSISLKLCFGCDEHFCRMRAYYLVMGYQICWQLLSVLSIIKKILIFLLLLLIKYYINTFGMWNLINVLIGLFIDIYTLTIISLLNFTQSHAPKSLGVNNKIIK